MLSSAETRLLHAVKSRAGREKNAAFAVEGVRVVEDLIAARADLKFAVVSPSFEDTKRGRALIQALEPSTPVRRVSEAELRDLADTDTPQGIVAVAKISSHSLANLKVSAHATVLVLDAVQDPGNLGTLIRTADAFACDAVVALPGTVDFWNPKVLRSAAGAAFRVPLVSAAAADTWAWLEQGQFEICGADMAGTPAAATSYARRTSLVVGNEGAGLRAETRDHVTQLISIPMPGRAESLNVAIAAAILLYELSRTNR